MRTFLIIAISLLLPLGAAAIDYPAIERKAARFYADHEWASALAMYELMLSERPDVTATYGNAIVAAAVTSQPSTEVALLEQAMRHRVPLDSLFSSVETRSFALGRADIYEEFLLLVKERQPWMTRNINARLLDYYTFRREPDKMIEMARLMLDGLPDSIQFLSLLARGQMMRGDTADSLATYRHILQLDPDNYDALLELGNYALLQYDATPSDTSARDSAITYLTRANALHPTPYVTAALARLAR